MRRIKRQIYDNGRNAARVAMWLSERPARSTNRSIPWAICYAKGI